MFKKQILGASYIPPYAEDYFKLPWYMRDLMAYFSHLDYKEMSDNSTTYFRDKKVVNFDIIHHGYCGDKLENSYKNHKTVRENDLINCLEKEKQEALSGAFRNIKRDDLWLQRDLMIEYLRKVFTLYLIWCL